MTLRVAEMQIKMLLSTTPSQEPKGSGSNALFKAMCHRTVAVTSSLKEKAEADHT